MRRFPPILVLLLAFASCSDIPPIDPSLTFNIVRSADFQVSNPISGGIDASITAHVHIDTTKDYATNETAAYLLRSARVTRLVLTSNDISLDNISSARMLIGADTVADSILSATANEIDLRTTNTDLTKHMQDTAFDAVLQVHLQNVINAGTINASMTVVHTALHLPFTQ